MHNLVKPKSLVAITLSLVSLFTYLPLNATGLPLTPSPPTYPTPSEHKQTITQFLNEIQLIQNQVYDITQFAIQNPSEVNPQIENRISLINTNIERLNRRIEDYLAIVSGISDENRHVALTFNVINLVKSGLYTLTLLINTTADERRISLLDEYFRTRINALDTLEILQELLANY
ncbi:MAG: hypothetical protein K0R69_2435 [Clostridia bacterium]|jgi:hypothetical protein|nr:hypothetical protein [Clostridia bacterium]